MAKVRANWYAERGISKARYCELMWFARQYDEYKADPKWAWKIAAIEQAAAIAAPGFCAELLKNVTRDVAWEYMGAPVARKQFYEARRKFYLELHLLLKKR